MADFKKLSAVEAIEAVSDTANVLIEENGVIKKAPKTAVGGAGGSEPDLVIAINNHYIKKITADAYHIECGNVEAVINAIGEGRMPNIKMRFYLNANAENVGEYIPVLCAEIMPQLSFYGENMYLEYTAGYGNCIYKGCLHLYLDGSFNLATLHRVFTEQIS